MIRGKHESRPEGARRPTAGDEPREFTSRGEGGRVPPFIEKLPNFVLMNLLSQSQVYCHAQIVKDEK